MNVCRLGCDGPHREFQDISNPMHLSLRERQQAQEAGEKFASEQDEEGEGGGYLANPLIETGSPPSGSPSGRKERVYRAPGPLGSQVRVMKGSISTFVNTINNLPTRMNSASLVASFKQGDENYNIILRFSNLFLRASHKSFARAPRPKLLVSQ